MIIRYNVHSNNAPKNFEINVDTVYRRTNIHTYIDNDGIEGYEYDEDELSLIEYFRDAVPQNDESLGELSILFAAYQAQMDQTIAELSMIVGGQQDV